MVTFNLKDIIDFAVENHKIYTVYFEKEYNMLGVIVFIYHKKLLNIDYGDYNLNQLHKYMNGLVIQSFPSDKYKLLICPDDPDNNFIYVYKYEANKFITNHTDSKFNKEISEKIINFYDFTNFKFKIESSNQDECLSLVKYY